MSAVVLTKTHKGRVWNVELNRPEKRNALSAEIINRLTDIFQSVSEDPLVQLLILSGRGPSFCAGGDLRWLLLPADSSDTENLNSAGLLFNLFHKMDQCPVPLLGRIHGSVYGGGVGLVSVCDIVSARTGTEFCFSELRLALVPSVISPFILKKMPLYRAKAYMFSARKFSAEEAEGLIHFSGSGEECESYIKDLTDRMLQFDRQALRQTKDLLRKVSGSSVESLKDYCVGVLAGRRKSPSVAEKINRFLKAKGAKNPAT